MSMRDSIKYVSDNFERVSKTYGKDTERISDHVDALYEILENDISMKKKLFIAMLNSSEQIEVLQDYFGFSKAAIYHNRYSDAIKYMRDMILYESLDHLYEQFSTVNPTSKDEFAFTWSIAVTSGALGGLYKDIKKDE